jgi:chemotaxis protein methyltransferase CheR
VGINTGAMDLILCRNVLMYFTPAQRERVAGTLARCLAEGGALIVSPSESSDALFASLEARRLSGMAIYEKIRRRGAAGPPPLVETEAPRRASREVGWTPQAQASRELTPARLPAPEERPEERKDEESTEARSRRLANEGRLDEALLLCRRAVEENKCDPEAYVLLAAILLELGRPREAVEQLKKALYLDQGFVIAHVMLGNIESRQERRAQGRRHLRNACILLEGRPREEIVPGSAGLTAARLLEIIRSTPGEGLE